MGVVVVVIPKIKNGERDQRKYHELISGLNVNDPDSVISDDLSIFYVFAAISRSRNRV